jgi:hypothetical protein
MIATSKLATSLYRIIANAITGRHQVHIKHHYRIPGIETW